MYDENSYKNLIFWIKVKTVFLLIIFTILGRSIGVIASCYIIDILMVDPNLRPVIIIVSAILFLLVALLLTANTAKTIQDGYWKIAVLRKLTLISKKLDSLENLENLDSLKNLNKRKIKNENLNS